MMTLGRIREAGNFNGITIGAEYGKETEQFSVGFKGKIEGILIDLTFLRKHQAEQGRGSRNGRKTAVVKSFDLSALLFV